MPLAFGLIAGTLTAVLLLSYRRRMRIVFPLQRVGYLVHGYGVSHAHFIIVPQQGPYHLTSDRFARVENEQVVFDLNLIPTVDRQTLDDHAKLLAQTAS